MMKKFKPLFVVFFLLVVINDSYGLNKNYVETRIKSVKAAIKEKKAGYLKIRAQYAQLVSKTKKTKNSIYVLKRKIQKNQKSLDRLNKKIDVLKKDIDSVSLQLVVQKKELYKEFNKYYQYSMTSGYYKKGVWYDYMNLFIIRYMQNKIKNYISKRIYLKNRLDTLKIYVAKKKAVISKIKSQQNALKKQVEQLSFLTKESLQKRKDYLKQIRHLSMERNNLQNILSQIIENERKRALEEKKENKQKTIVGMKKHKVMTVRQKSVVSSYNVKKKFGALKGSLMPPVRGKIVDTFGKKYDTLFKVYTRSDGIDIRVKKGECVRSIYRGKVDYIGTLPGYGGVIIINHLNGYYSVYGGVKQKVRTGEIVKMQECIGITQTNKLHFELRKHAVAINPLKLLDRRYLR